MKAAGPAALIAAEQAEDAGSECPYGRIEPGRGTDRVAHRHRERRGFDLEHVAGLRLDTLAERQRRGAEKMDVDIAGAAEAGIFEMVVFEVADRVRHIRLTRDEGLFPDRLAVAHDAAGAFDMIGGRAETGRASCRERVWQYVCISVGA